MPTCSSSSRKVSCNRTILCTMAAVVAPSAVDNKCKTIAITEVAINNRLMRTSAMDKRTRKTRRAAKKVPMDKRSSMMNTAMRSLKRRSRITCVRNRNSTVKTVKAEMVNTVTVTKVKTAVLSTSDDRL